MRILVYKRTHEGDPDPNTKRFGVWDCMGKVRDQDFDAVVGVGGIGKKARDNCIASKFTWFGAYPKKERRRCRQGYVATIVSFQEFKYYGTDGPDLYFVAPVLADTIYAGKIRYLIVDERYPEELREAARLIELPINPSTTGADRRASLKSNNCRIVRCNR